jgi:protein-tyrosine-phosphatase
VKVMIVCFANTCRSPSAEALLAKYLGPNSDVELSSRGLAGGPGDMPDALVRALHDRELELQSPAGERFDPHEGLACDLLLFADRSLLREAVVREPRLWPRAFTWREFARRGWLNPPRPLDEDFGQWVSLLHSSRNRNELLGESSDDDVHDPGLGGTYESYLGMVDSLAREARQIAELLSAWSTSA